jgi:hypothetical protein
MGGLGVMREMGRRNEVVNLGHLGHLILVLAEKFKQRIKPEQIYSHGGFQIAARKHICLGIV